MKSKNLLKHVRMDDEIITIGDTEIEKQKFYHYESRIT